MFRINTHFLQVARFSFYFSFALPMSPRWLPTMAAFLVGRAYPSRSARATCATHAARIPMRVPMTPSAAPFPDQVCLNAIQVCLNAILNAIKVVNTATALIAFSMNAALCRRVPAAFQVDCNSFIGFIMNATLCEGPDAF